MKLKQLDSMYNIYIYTHTHTPHVATLTHTHALITLVHGYDLDQKAGVESKCYSARLIDGLQHGSLAPCNSWTVRATQVATVLHCFERREEQMFHT